MARTNSQRRLQATTIVAMLVLASSARAQSAETPDAMIERALDLREAGNDVEAHALIVRAHDLSPTPRSAAQLGLVEQALGLFVVAEQHLARALAAVDDAWIVMRRARLEESLAGVRQRLGSVEILTNVPGARVSIGGEVVGTTPFAAPVRVQIGTVPVDVSLDGYRAQSISIVVIANELSRQTVRLQPIPREEPRPVTADALPPVEDEHVIESPTRRAPVDRPDDGSIFGQWWFWTIIVVVVAGAGIPLAIVLSGGTLTSDPPHQPLITGDEPAGGVIETLSLAGW